MCVDVCVCVDVCSSACACLHTASSCATRSPTHAHVRVGGQNALTRLETHAHAHSLTCSLTHSHCHPLSSLMNKAPETPAPLGALAVNLLLEPEYAKQICNSKAFEPLMKKFLESRDVYLVRCGRGCCCCCCRRCRCCRCCRCSCDDCFPNCVSVPRRQPARPRSS